MRSPSEQRRSPVRRAPTAPVAGAGRRRRLGGRRDSGERSSRDGCSCRCSAPAARAIGFGRAPPEAGPAGRSYRSHSPPRRPPHGVSRSDRPPARGRRRGSGPRRPAALPAGPRTAPAGSARGASAGDRASTPRPVAPSTAAKRMSVELRGAEPEEQSACSLSCCLRGDTLVASSIASTSSVSPSTATTRTREPGGSSELDASLPELAEDADLARGGEPLRHLAGCADELLDACLNLPAPHAPLEVHDLDDADRDAREPADDVPRRGQREEEQQTRAVRTS